MTDIKLSPWASIVGPCYTAMSFAHELGWSASEVEDAASALRILEVETEDGVLLYPAFQLWNGRIVDGLQGVLSALHSGTASRWTWAQWLNTTAHDESGNQVPRAVDRLRAGQLAEVLRDAQHIASAWSI